LGIEQFLETERIHAKESLQEWFNGLLPYRLDIKRLFGFWVNPDKDSPVAIAQKFLEKLGLKMACHRTTRKGETVRSYRLESLDPDNRGEVFRRWFDRDNANQ
jgi:hypothetical protein